LFQLLARYSHFGDRIWRCMQLPTASNTGRPGSGIEDLWIESASAPILVSFLFIIDDLDLSPTNFTFEC